MKKLFYSLIAFGFFVQLALIFLKPEPNVQKTKSKPTLQLKPAAFEHLPGWKEVDAKKSLQAFQISCKAFLKQNPEKSVGSNVIELKAKDWYPACKAAMALESSSNKVAKAFFQTWFSPVEFFDSKPIDGLFTGYYMPLLHGSLTKKGKYNVPIYATPHNLVTAQLGDFSPDLTKRRIAGQVNQRHLIPYFTREQINNGAIDKFAKVLVWVDSKFDRLILEIEGSGIVKLDNGDQLALGYATENGAPYTSVASVLIKKGVMTRDNASMQHIRRYLHEHPQQLDPVINKNKSFVFFNKLKNNFALGAQGVALTPGYSLAVDLKWIPLGVPLWLSTTRPDHKLEKQTGFNRLMIAQDTGGAIRGAVRGDVYWGEGEKATEIAGRMKNPGHYWLLLPRHVTTALEQRTHLPKKLVG